MMTQIRKFYIIMIPDYHGAYIYGILIDGLHLHFATSSIYTMLFFYVITPISYVKTYVLTDRNYLL